MPRPAMLKTELWLVLFCMAVLLTAESLRIFTHAALHLAATFSLVGSSLLNNLGGTLVN